eukprot:scaffold5150_cov150-Skeletonema_dohrnii-CCMP3373.AAC.2
MDWLRSVFGLKRQHQNSAADADEDELNSSEPPSPSPRLRKRNRRDNDGVNINFEEDNNEGSGNNASTGIVGRHINFASCDNTSDDDDSNKSNSSDSSEEEEEEEEDVLNRLGDRIIRFNYTGEDRRVPDDATHITVDQSVRVIPENAFRGNDNIVEVICDVNVKGVGGCAFDLCLPLRRVIMPGVEVVEEEAFLCCRALTYVECGKLEIIKVQAFGRCESLRSINLPSAKIVEEGVFWGCEALTDVKFGSKLERIKEGAFVNCPFLERITIPLKDGIVADDDIFRACDNLKHVDLVEGPVHATIAALQLEEWRNDMYGEINSINQILPTTPAGEGYFDQGGKARAIRTWIRSVLGKIIHYKAEHQRLLNEQVATTLGLALSQDIVMNNVLPFLELPSYTFEVGDHEEGEEQDDLASEEEDHEE